MRSTKLEIASVGAWVAGWQVGWQVVSPRSLESQYVATPI